MVPESQHRTRDELARAFEAALAEEARLRQQAFARTPPDRRAWEAWLHAVDATNAASHRLHEQVRRDSRGANPSQDQDRQVR